MAVAAATLALILCGIPLAAAARVMIQTEERGELERTALAAALQVGPDFTQGDQVELPPTEDDKRVSVYDADLHLRLGQGPTTADTVTKTAAAGHLADGLVDGELVVAVPVTSAETIVGVVRAATATRTVWQWIVLTWLVLAALAGASLATAVMVARRQARLLSEPLESLAATAERVAAGDLTVRAAANGIPEITRVAETQNAMLDRLTELLERERQFSADASHQLRTPLTGLQLGLENALDRAATTPATDLRPALLEGIDRARELEQTVTEILRLSQAAKVSSTSPGSRPLAEVLADVDRGWHGRLAEVGRRLRVHVDPTDEAMMTPGFVPGEVLAVLLDNALTHGRGEVSVSVRLLGDVLAIDVADEGSIRIDPSTVFDRGNSGAGGPGIGLAFARSIAQASGGRLRLASAAPTRFTLLIPRPPGGE